MPNRSRPSSVRRVPSAPPGHSPRGHAALIALALAGLAGPPAAAAWPGPEELRPFEVDRRNSVTAAPRLDAQARLTGSAAWRRYAAEHPGWRVRWNESTAAPERMTGPGAAPPGRFVVTDATVESVARDFVATAGGPWLAGLELEPVRSQATGAGWAPAGGAGGGRRGGSTGWWVHFTQRWRGLPVHGSRLSLRVTPDGRVPVVTNHTWAGIDAPTRASIPAGAAVRAAAEGFDRLPPAVGEPSLVILPIARGDGTEYHLAWRVETRTGIDRDDEPIGHWISFVDARSGALLWRFNNARDAVVRGEVRGDIEMVAPNDDYTRQGLAWLTFTARGPADTASTTTDALGRFSLPFGPTTGRSYIQPLQGPFGRIENMAIGGGATTLANPLADGDSTVVDLLFDAANSPDSERDAWFHGMVAHDYIKTIEPGFAACDYPMPIRVELNRTCNAFWDGFGINFFSEGGGCANTGRMATVVLHEYGHAITDYLYRPFFPSGAMHEGFSDYYACIITNQPIMGPGFQGPSTIIRRIDTDHIFPRDANGEVHNDGLIIASALWDAREALGSAHADSLWHFARYGYADNFDDYFFDYLIEDDDDDDVYNGTPNLATIAGIFLAHGIGDFDISVEHTPYADTEDTAQAFPLTASFFSVFPLEADSVMAHITLEGSEGIARIDTAMTPTGAPRQFSTTIPARPAGALVRYRFTAHDTTGAAVTWPAEGDFVFRVGPDATPPVIVHEASRDQPIDQPGVSVQAHITDNLDKGVGDRILYTQTSGAAAISDLAALNPRPTPDDYGATINLNGSALGDLFEYQITAFDKAAALNGATSPPTGYHSFHIVRGFGRDFEASDGGFTATGDFQWGAPDSPASPAPSSGANVWATKLTGAYSDASTSLLDLPAVNLAGWTKASLVFRHWYSTEPDFDGGAVYISTNDGGTWLLLTPDGGYPHPGVVALGSPGFNGDSQGWQSAEFDLTRYVGQAALRIRLQFSADEALHGPGWYVDDLQVVERQTFSRPLALTAGSGLRNRVPLAWRLPAGQEGVEPSPVLGYDVYRSTAAAPTWVRLNAGPLTGRSYLDEAVQNGNSYRYHVTARYAEGESGPTATAIGFPYTARLDVTTDTYVATLAPAAQLDTLMTVENGGTGFLQVNAYVGSLAQTIDDVRYAMVVGDTSSAALPPPRPTGASTDAGAGGGAAPADEPFQRLAAGIAAARERWKAGRLPLPALAAPEPLSGAAVAWDTLGTDPPEVSGAIPDLRTFASRLTATAAEFQISAWQPWGAFDEFNVVVAIDIDGNSTNGFGGGEYLAIGGNVIQASFGQPALLLSSDFVPVGFLSNVRFASGDSVAEFGVKLADIENPGRITLTLLSLDAGGARLLDRMPDRTPAFFALANRYLLVSQGTPGAYSLRFNATGLTPGYYEALLFLDSNDPDRRSLELPMRMNVSESTPVELAEFSATARGDGVALRWRTTAERENVGFHVYRREAGADGHGARLTEALIPARPGGDYAYLDGTAMAGRPYEYHLADVSRAGEVRFHGPLAVTAGPDRPGALSLAPVSPNPARGQAVIRFGVPGAGRVSLRLFRVDGRLVRTLAEADALAAGWHEARWDGRDDGGNTAPAGLYFVRIETPAGALARKLIWAR